MKKLNFLLVFLTLSLASVGLKAQEGLYLEPQFDVEVTLDVQYGINATILPVLFQQSDEALPRPLTMDIYEPVGDDGNRPVMLVFHSGNFLPFPDNNGTSGTTRDSAVVEVCTRLAERGYVAASIDYRLGWNPFDPSQDFRKFFLINAAYRGVQDARTAVRFLRKLAVDGDAEGNVNPYDIDPEKIGLWGIGTGGYIVAATATIDEYEEIVISKFLIDLGAGPSAMVIEEVNGDIFGTSFGVVPPGYPVLPTGDTLCYPNHVTYANGDTIPSDISMVVNNGGALGDISWIDENTPPWVSFHTPLDFFAPYTTGVLKVPGTGDDPDDPSDDFAVVEVSGSYDIQARMNELGNNDLFEMIDPAVLDYDEVADSRNDGNEGLFPFPTGDPLDSAPWDFFAEDNVNYDPETADVPLMPERAKSYWDTVMAYTGVRACIAMELGCNLTNLSTIDPMEVNLLAAPNPSVDEIQVSVAPEYTIQAMELYDVGGRLMRTYFDVNNHQHTVYRNELSAGIYYLRVRLEEGMVFQKLIFN
jgi:hypothetical protein